MKKILGLLVVVALLIGCNKEESIPDGDRTTIDLVIGGQLRGDVNRDDVPVWVKDITIDVIHDQTQELNSTTFTLVDNGSGEDGFRVENVLYGPSTINAASTSNGWRKYDSYRVNIVNDTPQEILQNFRANNPYATYISNTLTPNINTDESLYNLDMTTNHGRIISLFQISPNAVSSAYITVKSTSSVSESYVEAIASNKAALFYWSNENAVDGETIVHTINIHHRASGELLSTLTVNNLVRSSRSTSTIYTISADEIIKEEQGFDFNWQVWIED